MKNFKTAKFDAFDNRARFMTSIVGGYVNFQNEMRVLDIGCGSGAQIFYLAKLSAHSKFLGIDLSVHNIEQAQAEARTFSNSKSLNFEIADYMTFNSKPFDLIIADSIFHLIEANSGEIILKLASDLKPGGIIFLAIPVRCFYNTLLFGIRKILQLFRSSFTDTIILWAARLIHGGTLEAESLRQRVPYMYIIPFRLWDDKLKILFLKDELFMLEQEISIPQASLGQPKHSIAVLRRNK